VNVFFQWAARRILAQPVRLLAAYAASFFGSALGFGAYVYWSYRYQGLFDSMRIGLAVERGILIGAPFGFGLFITRLIAERLSRGKPFIRLVLATGLGAVVLTLTISLYYFLYLQYPPAGVLVPISCLVTALGFACGALRPSRLWKIGLSSIAFFTAVTGSWLAYIQFAPSPTGLSPLLNFDTASPILSVLAISLITVVMMTVFGNLIDLSLPEG